MELLLEFHLEPIPNVNGIRTSLDAITPSTPLNKCNILKGENNITHHLGAFLDAHCPEIGFEFPKEIIYLLARLTPWKADGGAFPFRVVGTWTTLS